MTRPHISLLLMLLLALLTAGHDTPRPPAHDARPPPAHSNIIRSGLTPPPPERLLPAAGPQALNRRAAAPPRRSSRRLPRGPLPSRFPPEGSRATSGTPAAAPPEAVQDAPATPRPPAHPDGGPAYTPAQTARHRAHMLTVATENPQTLREAGAQPADFARLFERRVHQMHPDRRADFVARLLEPRVRTGPQGARGRLRALVDEAVRRALWQTHREQWLRSDAARRRVAVGAE